MGGGFNHPTALSGFYISSCEKNCMFSMHDGYNKGSPINSILHIKRVNGFQSHLLLHARCTQENSEKKSSKCPLDGTFNGKTLYLTKYTRARWSKISQQAFKRFMYSMLVNYIVNVFPWKMPSSGHFPFSPKFLESISCTVYISNVVTPFSCKILFIGEV